MHFYILYITMLQVLTRKISSGNMRGERRSRRRGYSTDFADYRNYAFGDDTRYLDWKIFARLEKLYLKLFLEEEDLQLHLILDASASMDFGDPNKFLYARRLAAALGYISLCSMDSVHVHTFNNGLQQTWGPKRGKVNGMSLFDFLQNQKAADQTSLADSLNTFSQKVKRKGVVVLISDFYDFDGYEEGLRKLFGRNFDVFVLHLLSPEEIKPDLKGDVRLMDVEFDISTDISVGNSLMKLYDQTLNTFCMDIKDYVMSRGGYYLLVNTELPFEKLVLDVLCRKGLVR